MEQGEIKGVKRRVEAWGGRGGDAVAVPSERRRGMLDVHIQSPEREKKRAAATETASKSNI